MYYQSYDDYMRSSLGYDPSTLNNSTYAYMPQPMYDDYNMQDLNEFYPDIYKVVYPAVCKVCSGCTARSFTNSTIEDMVDKVYGMIEESNSDMIECRNVESKSEQSGVSSSTDKRIAQRQEKRMDGVSSSEKETRAPKNFLLNDLIRILVLRELIGNRPPWNSPWPGVRPTNRPPQMPPPPGGGMRPPRYF